MRWVQWYSDKSNKSTSPVRQPAPVGENHHVGNTNCVYNAHSTATTPAAAADVAVDIKTTNSS